MAASGMRLPGAPNRAVPVLNAGRNDKGEFQMTGKFLTMIAAGALMTGPAGIALAQTNGQYGTDQQQPDQAGMRATHALNMLEDQGYGQFANFSPAGRNFTADVTKNGRTYAVVIDPSTGQIQPQTSGNATM
jgi:hypothetical protein